MKHLRDFKNEDEKIYVITVNKKDLEQLKKRTDNLKYLEINFKVLDSGSRNKNYYYILSPDLNSYNFSVTEDELETFGDEIDYKILIASNKYNL